MPSNVPLDHSPTREFQSAPSGRCRRCGRRGCAAAASRRTRRTRSVANAPVKICKGFQSLEGFPRGFQGLPTVYNGFQGFARGTQRAPQGFRRFPRASQGASTWHATGAQGFPLARGSQRTAEPRRGARRTKRAKRAKRTKQWCGRERAWQLCWRRSVPAPATTCGASGRRPWGCSRRRIPSASGLCRPGARAACRDPRAAAPAQR